MIGQRAGRFLWKRNIVPLANLVGRRLIRLWDLIAHTPLNLVVLLGWALLLWDLRLYAPAGISGATLGLEAYSWYRRIQLERLIKRAQKMLADG